MKEINKTKELNSKEDNFDKWTIARILLLVFVVSGIFGFIYETFFYRIDLGYFVKRGTTYGPWIPIYGYGGVLIAVMTYKFRKKPIVVFILSLIISGTIEFLVGYLLFNIKGIRLWDYNIEIWNFGNIGGFICLRSLLFFGISGMLLIYCIIPVLKKIANYLSETALTLVSLIPGIMFIVDIIISSLEII